MSRKKFCEMCYEMVVPAKDGDCPECGAGLTAVKSDPREWNEDDGLQYADPRDRRDERLD